MEYNKIDILNEKGEKTGESLGLIEAHEQGKWHAAAHIWIFTRQGELLLQKRSKKALTYPGIWDLSAAGHVDTGESVEEAAVREVEEEIGLKILAQDLEFVFVEKIDILIPVKKWQNREFEHVFLLEVDDRLVLDNLQEDEVEKIGYFDLDEFEKMINDDEEYKKFVPHDTYYHKIIKEIRERLEKNDLD